MLLIGLNNHKFNDSIMSQSGYTIICLSVFLIFGVSLSFCYYTLYFPEYLLSLAKAKVPQQKVFLSTMTRAFKHEVGWAHETPRPRARASPLFHRAKSGWLRDKQLTSSSCVLCCLNWRRTVKVRDSDPWSHLRRTQEL